MRSTFTLLLFCLSLGFCIQTNAQSIPVTAGAEDFIISETMDNSYDFDDDKNEKMSIDIKEKRVSDNKFIDAPHVKSLLIAFLINIISIMIVVRGLYYPKCKRGEFFFTYIMIAISTLMLI